MKNLGATELSYFPGCSLASTASENKISLDHLLSHLGFNLIELEGWNCCGSSSAHSISAELAHDLSTRNLSLAPPGRPLLVACPSCLLRLRGAHILLKQDEKTLLNYEKRWGRPFNPGLKIVHYFELLDRIDLPDSSEKTAQKLGGLKFVPYYGCMLSHPPVMRRERTHHGLMENILSSSGAIPVSWTHSFRCCGTYLNVARPDVVTPMVSGIIRNAINAGADCIVTACAMCQMNLEIRCTSKLQLPIMHFSEVLAMGLGVGKEEYSGWFSRHLVNPKKLFKAIGSLNKQ